MIELTWDTDHDDLDSYLIRSGGTYRRINVLVFEDSKLLYEDEVWDCAYIERPSGTVYSSLQ